MKMKISAIAAAICGMCSLGVNAAQLTVPITASATVNNSCSTPTASLNFPFGTLNGGQSSASAEKTATVSVSCTSATSYKFSTDASTPKSTFVVGKASAGTVPTDCQPEIGAGGIGSGNINIGRDGITCPVFTPYGTVTLAVKTGSTYTSIDAMTAITATAGPAADVTTIYGRISGGTSNPFNDAAAKVPTTEGTYTEQAGSALYITY